MKKHISYVLVASILGASQLTYAQSGVQQTVKTVEAKSLRQQKLEQLKLDLQTERDQLSALEKIRASGLGISQSWGKHAVVAVGSLGAALLITGLNRDEITGVTSRATKWVAASLGTLVGAIGEQIIVWVDESKLANDISNSRYNIDLIKSKINKLKSEVVDNNITDAQSLEIKELEAELTRSQKDLADLINIRQKGVSVTAQAGKHLVAVGLSASAAMMLKGGMEKPNATAIAGAAAVGFALREAFIVVGDNSKMNEMILEKREVINSIQSQIERIESGNNKQ